jgi:hypothetical protein
MAYGDQPILAQKAQSTEEIVFKRQSDENDAGNGQTDKGGHGKAKGYEKRILPALRQPCKSVDT